MFTQTKKQKAIITIKAIKQAYKARKLTPQQRDFMLNGVEHLL